MTRRPTVSVCIPTYNRAGMLRDAIDSVLSQTFQDYEIIICDNASTDDTAVTVRSFRDRRIVYTRSDCTIGQRQNWNRCLSLARGEFVAVFPDDDLMLPGNLQQKVELLSRHEEVGLVHSGYHVVDPGGEILRSNTHKEGCEYQVNTIEDGRQVLAILLKRNVVHESTVVFRRVCYERLGGFTERLTLAFDWEYWMRIAECYAIGFIPAPLVKWRAHAGSLTQRARSRVREVQAEAFRALVHDLDGLRWVLRRYLPRVRTGRVRVRACVWQHMGGLVTDHAEALLGTGGAGSAARAFILSICRSYPEVLIQPDVWKAFLKTLLSRQSILALKRISPL